MPSLADSTDVSNKNKKKNFTLISNELIDMPTISPETFAVFSVIARHNPSFPSYKIIMVRLRMRRPMVSYRIKELRARNIISYIKGNSKAQANLYFINPDRTTWDLLMPTEELVLDGEKLGRVEKRSERSKAFFKEMKDLREMMKEFQSTGSDAEPVEKADDATTSSDAEPVTSSDAEPVVVRRPNSNNTPKKYSLNNTNGREGALGLWDGPAPPGIQRGEQLNLGMFQVIDGECGEDFHKKTTMVFREILKGLDTG